MLNVGVIASSATSSHLGQVAGNNYTGAVVNYVPPAVPTNSAAAPVAPVLTVGVQFGVGNVATWDPTLNPPGTIYTVFVYDPSTATTTQYTNSTGAGIASVPPGGAVAVQAVVTDNGITTYSDFGTYIPPASLGITLGPGGHL